MFRFTVVTPSYNQADYIADTIESVISQEGAFLIEYFVVDGGSTDGSQAIIERYANRLEDRTWPVRCAGISVVWESARDRGQSDALNKGLRRATGDVCCYLNSDDTFPPGAFAAVMKAFIDHPEADFVYGDGEVIDEQNQLKWVWLSRPYNHRILTSYHFAWNAFPNYVMQQSTFWRRSVMGRIGYFDEAMHYAMDLEYWVRAGAAGLCLMHVPRKLGRFRMIEGTKSLSSPTAFWEDQLEIYRRHHGSGRLAPYFCFYYFNVAQGCEGDIAGALVRAETVFQRWNSLAPAELDRLRSAATRGAFWAALLLAITMQSRGRSVVAQAAYRHAVEGKPLRLLHPLVLLYMLRRAAGPGLVNLADRSWNAAIAWYRRTYVDYRYFEAAE